MYAVIFWGISVHDFGLICLTSQNFTVSCDLLPFLSVLLLAIKLKMPGIGFALGQNSFNKQENAMNSIIKCLYINCLLLGVSSHASAGELTIHMRSFARFNQFGGGFEGDRRGFSKDINASSRIHTRVVYNYKSGRVLRKSSSSSPTVHLPTGQTSTSTPRLSVTQDCGYDLCVSHAGAKPVTKKWVGDITPDIDLHCYLNFVESGNYIEVSVKALGDAFPDAEVFLEDSRGNTVFLLKFKTEGGTLTGIGNLIGDTKSFMGAADCKIGLDGNDNFDGEVYCR